MLNPDTKRLGEGSAFGGGVGGFGGEKAEMENMRVLGVGKSAMENMRRSPDLAATAAIAAAAGEWGERLACCVRG